LEEPLLNSLLRALSLALVAGLLHACATPSAPTPSPAPSPAPAVQFVEPPLAPAPPPTPLPSVSKEPAAPVKALAPLPPVPVAVLEPRSPIATVDATQPRDDLWDRIRKGFAMPDLDGPIVRRQVAYYKSHPDYLQRSFDRARFYLYHIVSEIERRGMPTELALLPMVESAFNPMAYSRAHASGLWQFIPGTGRRFELEQTWWYDERRDIVDSTNAALDYLQFLYDLHHDWHLALASYNWGEGSVSRAIARNRRAGKPLTYKSLRMPRETRSYVPKLQALKNIIRDPARFGIDLDPIPNEPYFVQLSETPEMDLALAARLAEMPVEEFVALNPGFSRPLIRASQTSRLVLPSSKVAVFYANLAKQKGAGLVSWQVYRPKKGEKFGTIAKKHGLSIAELKKVNGIPKRSWRVPQVLVVPTRPEALAATKLPVMYAPPIPVRGRVGIVHRVRSGDTLTKIARRYGVSVRALKQWNHAGDRLRVGQKIYIRKNLL
jgi:membrane-bound lytic murein transglycosylase D